MAHNDVQETENQLTVKYVNRLRIFVRDEVEMYRIFILNDAY